ncbi:MAG: hypothetical protein L0I76_23055 [Pseudonocardia sp.]|nr:hypothetical protein [Pseudonocardia sp.]
MTGREDPQAEDRPVFWAAIRGGYSYEQAELRQLRADREQDAQAGPATGTSTRRGDR